MHGGLAGEAASDRHSTGSKSPLAVELLHVMDNLAVGQDTIFHTPPKHAAAVLVAFRLWLACVTPSCRPAGQGKATFVLRATGLGVPGGSEKPNSRAPTPVKSEQAGNLPASSAANFGRKQEGLALVRSFGYISS